MIPLVTHPSYSYEFNTNHRFPMEKFALLSEHLKRVGILSSANCFRPGRAKQQVLEHAHCEHYLHRFIHNTQSTKELRRMGLPWSEGLAKRTLISPNGTLLAASLALQHGVACHLAGGTHHAHRDFASGFCILNDLAITALTLIRTQRVKRVLIFDCDVHQGDGTASILQNESQAFTCSIHCEKNFPVRKARSDLDIGLDKGLEDTAYIDIVVSTFKQLIADVDPCLVIYDAGVDVFKDDPLGLLSVSEQGIRERDHQVLAACQNKNIPVVTVIGGGYDDDRLALAKRHAIVTEEAHRLYAGA